MSDNYKDLWPDMDVAYLVLARDDFIVCIDHEDDVDWKTNDNFKGHKDEEAHNATLNRMAILESLPTYDLDKKIRISYKRMLGEAIARSLSGDYANAAKILDDSEAFIKLRNSELTRSWYLTTGISLTCILIIVSGLMWFWRELVQDEMGVSLFWLIIAAIAGAVGALFSIIMRMGKETLDSSAGKRLHQLECVSRIVAGMISAVVVGLAVYSEIIFPVFSKNGNARAFLMLTAMSAGSIERWAPSLIERIAKNDKSLTDKKVPKSDSSVIA